MAVALTDISVTFCALVYSRSHIFFVFFDNVRCPQGTRTTSPERFFILHNRPAIAHSTPAHPLYVLVETPIYNPVWLSHCSITGLSLHRYDQFHFLQLNDRCSTQAFRYLSLPFQPLLSFPQFLFFPFSMPPFITFPSPLIWARDLNPGTFLKFIIRFGAFWGRVCDFHFRTTVAVGGCNNKDKKPAH